MLKIYTDKNFLNETYRRKVFPVLFDVAYTKNKALLDAYTLVDTPEASDVMICPVDYATFFKQQKAFMKLLKTARIHAKPIWLYTAGDYGFTANIKNSYTFRLGGFDSQLNENTYVMPSFINDPYDTFLKKGFGVLQKEDKPSIGFVGHAQSGMVKYFKEYLNHFKYKLKRRFRQVLADKQTFYPSSIKRVKYLLTLQKNKRLKTDFILRRSYRAGAHSAQTQKESALQFYTNIYTNAYTFCLRGVGNFSVRFYETLAVGRIPILLNTDCRLPMADHIEWDKHCVIIDENSKITVAEAILAFHNKLSNTAFEDLQRSNRTLWETHLKREAYFLKINEFFKSKLK